MLCSFSSCSSDEPSNPDGEDEVFVLGSEIGIFFSQEVDLGLSVKWAGWNVGASSPEEYGGYYAWGETEEKDVYYASTYKYYYDTNGDEEGDTYANIGNNISGTQYDVARQKWGNNWRMPTCDEFNELIINCTWIWASYKGTHGYMVTGPNGNSIFLPLAGFRHDTSLYSGGAYGAYWSGTLYEDEYEYINSYARNIFFIGNYRDLSLYGYGRHLGLTVRPVK